MMKEWYKSKRQSVEDKRHAKKIMDDQPLELEITEEIEEADEIEIIDEIDEIEEEIEFNSFFEEVLSKFPKKYSTIILNTYDKTRVQAEKVLADSKTQFDSIFEMFLEGVDEETKKRSHATVHAASLTSAIIGLSPIPFSDAFLLVPIQLTMMARLHKIYGQKFSENLGESLARELVIVGLGRSAVGNLLKFIPAVGMVAGAAINAVVASTITQALGWVTVKMLNDGEDIFDDVMSFKNQFKNVYDVLKSTNKTTE